MQDTPETMPRMRPWVRVVLFLSLALNLLLIGAAVGAVLHGPPGGPGSRTTVRDTALPYTRALAEDQRREIGRSLRKAVRATPEQRGALLDSYGDAVTLLQADPFDKVAFVSLLERQNASAASRWKLAQAALADHLDALPEGERRAYADRLAEEVAQLAKRRSPRHDHR